MADKKQLSEEDIKLQFIAPALNNAGWDNQHTPMEYAFTDARILEVAKDKFVTKRKSRTQVLP